MLLHSPFKWLPIWVSKLLGLMVFIKYYYEFSLIQCQRCHCAHYYFRDRIGHFRDHEEDDLLNSLLRLEYLSFSCQNNFIYYYYLRYCCSRELKNKDRKIQSNNHKLFELLHMQLLTHWLDKLLYSLLNNFTTFLFISLLLSPKIQNLPLSMGPNKNGLAATSSNSSYSSWSSS